MRMIKESMRLIKFGQGKSTRIYIHTTNI